MDDLLRRLEAGLAGRYTVTSELGRGGMAVVYRARDLRHERDVAIKVLPPHLSSAIGHERFLSEIRLAAGLSHPYVVPILDSGEADGLLFYVMPVVEGETLRERLTRDGPLPVEEARGVVREIAEALAHAHESGVVHRDVKPSNILLTREHALLADFGIARAARGETGDRLTGTGVLVGTPAYMSPQQALSGDELDGSADQYSLACVAYEMLTGRPPFVGPSPEAVLLSHATEPVTPIRELRPEVPASLAATVQRALAKNPADRFGSLEEFAGNLDGRALGVASSWAPLARAVGIIVVGLLATGAAWFAVDRLVDGSEVPLPPVGKVAILPCEVVGSQSEADADVGRELADDLAYWMDYARLVPVTDLPSWVGTPRVAELEAVSSRLGFPVFKCTIDVTHRDSVEVSYAIWNGELRQDSEMLPSVTNGVRELRSFASSVASTLVGFPMAGDDAFPGTGDPEAWALFREGDAAFEAGRLVAAESLFTAALREDPAYALARLRQSDARRWQLQPTGDPAALQELLLRHGDRLGAVSHLLLRAAAAPHEDSFDQFRRLLEELDGYAYAHLLYGDELLHRGPLFGFPVDSAEHQFRIATERKPGFWPAWEHLSMALMLLDREAASDSALNRLAELDSDSPYPIYQLYRFGWLERFHPLRALGLREGLLRDSVGLPVYARYVRYFDLPELQLALGASLRSLMTPGTPEWHSGVHATALGHAALGNIDHAVDTWEIAARELPEPFAGEVRLTARMWAVLSSAMGSPRLPMSTRDHSDDLRTIAADSTSAFTALQRARASWALALHDAYVRDGDAPTLAFLEHARRVSQLTEDFDLDPRMRDHLGAVSAAIEGDWERAVDLSADLVAYDSIGLKERPFNRALFYLSRGDWYAEMATVDETYVDSALAAWIWYQNTDIEGIPEREVQAAEIDGVFGPFARIRRARLAREVGRARLACEELRSVASRWQTAERPVLSLLSRERNLVGDGCDGMDLPPDHAPSP